MVAVGRVIRAVVIMAAGVAALNACGDSSDSADGAATSTTTSTESAASDADDRVFIGIVRTGDQTGLTTNDEALISSAKDYCKAIESSGKESADKTFHTASLTDGSWSAFSSASINAYCPDYKGAITTAARPVTTPPATTPPAAPPPPPPPPPPRPRASWPTSGTLLVPQQIQPGTYKTTSVDEVGTGYACSAVACSLTDDFIDGSGVTMWTEGEVQYMTIPPEAVAIKIMNLRLEPA